MISILHHSRKQLRTEMGLWIKNARKRQGYTQLWLSSELGLDSCQPISNIERGVAALPAKHVAKLAQALHLDPKEVWKRLEAIELAEFRSLERMHG